MRTRASSAPTCARAAAPLAAVPTLVVVVARGSGSAVVGLAATFVVGPFLVVFGSTVLVVAPAFWAVDLRGAGGMGTPR